MSLRPPATVPPADTEFNLLNSSERYNSVDLLSAKRIPALLPSVKPSVRSSRQSSLGDYFAHSALPQGGSLVITTTQTQIFVHSSAPEDPQPVVNGTASDGERENNPSIVPEAPRIPKTIDGQQYLYQLVIFSLGAAFATILHSHSGARGIALFGSDRVLAPPAEAPVLTEEAEAFIQKAQRQLYHLDRLDIQAQQKARLTLSEQFAQASGSALDNRQPYAWGRPIYADNLDNLDNLDNSDRGATDLGVTYLNVTHPPDWTISAASNSPPNHLPEISPVTDSPLTYPPATGPITHSGTEKVLLTHIPPQLSRLMNDPKVSFANLSVLRPESAQGELIGLLEQGEQSIALLKIQGTVQQVAVGDPVGNGMTFVGTTQGQAILELGDNRMTLAVGQTF